MDASLVFEIICDGEIFSQKSDEAGVLITCSPGGENKSSGVMIIVSLLGVGVALNTTVAEGTFVLVGDGVWEKVGARIGTDDRLSEQLLKTRLERRIE
jgi:hypothetical protein